MYKPSQEGHTSLMNKTPPTKKKKKKNKTKNKKDSITPITKNINAC